MNGSSKGRMTPRAWWCVGLVFLTAVSGVACRGTSGVLGGRGLGDAPGRTLEIKPPTGDLARFTKLEIHDFDNPLPGLISHRLVRNLSAEIALTAKWTKRYESVDQPKDEEVDPAASDTLIITGALLDIDSAATNSTGRRSPVDFITTEVSLVDKSTGQVLARLRVSGYAPQGTPADPQERALLANLAKTVLAYLPDPRR